MTLLLTLLCCWHAYWLSGMVMVVTKARGGRRSTILNTVWALTKWPALVYIPAEPALLLLEGRPLSVWYIVSAALQVFIWWSYRDSGDDDEFKKTKKRVLERVSEVGGRLVVVPATAH